MFWSLTPDFTLILFQDPEDGVEGFVGFLCPSYQMGQIEYISFLFYFFYQYDSFNQFIDYGCIDLAWAQVINAKFGDCQGQMSWLLDMSACSGQNRDFDNMI